MRLAPSSRNRSPVPRRDRPGMGACSLEFSAKTSDRSVCSLTGALRPLHLIRLPLVKRVGHRGIDSSDALSTDTGTRAKSRQAVCGRVWPHGVSLARIH